VNTLYIVYFKEVNAMSVCDKKICENCKYLWADYSVNAFECENNEVNEEEIDKYFSEGKEGCPHFVEIEQEDCEDYIIEPWEEEILDIIRDWCKREYGHDGDTDEEYIKANREVGLAYTECDDGSQVQVSCDIRNRYVIYKVRNEIIHINKFETSEDLKAHLEDLLDGDDAFSWMVQEYVDNKTGKLVCYVDLETGEVNNNE
jgi:hypothetical protein